jgi:hypothetical protein
VALEGDNNRGTHASLWPFSPAAIRTLKVGNGFARRFDSEHGFGFHFPAFHVWMACEKHLDRDSVDGSDSFPLPSSVMFWP